MPKIDEFRRNPEYAGLPDEAIVRSIALDYPDVPIDKIAADLGVSLNADAPQGRTLGGTVKDVGVSLAKGVVGVGETAVGLGDMVSRGGLGKLLEDKIGYRPAVAQQMLADEYSDPQKAAFQKVQDAHGVVDIAKEAITNPSTIAHSVIESLPGMAAGGAAARGIMGVGARVMGAEAAAAGSMGPYAVPGALSRAVGSVDKAAGIAGALGEGITMAGQDAEGIRQQTGTLDGSQTMDALAIGASGAGFAMLGASVAKKLGIHDVDTMIAAGHANPEAAKGFTRRLLEGAFSEGLLEELPQSITEQVLQNKATGKPLDEGVDNAAVMGFLAGAVMGAGANAVGGGHPQPSKIPGGPLAAAAATAGALAGPALAAPVADAGKITEAVQAGAAVAAEKPDPKAELERQVNLEKIAHGIGPDAEPTPQNDEQWDRDRAIYEDATGASALPTPPVGAAPVITPGTVDEAAHESHSSPTNDKTATTGNVLGGNAELGHPTVSGLGISIENADGSERVDKANEPPKWRTPMRGVHYGYFKGTTAADSTPGKKQGVDVFLRAGTPKDYAGPVYVVDQVHQHDGSFDEHKVMLGFANRGAAVRAYKAHYSAGWKMGRVTEMAMPDFKAWVTDKAATSKPASPKGALVAPDLLTGAPNATSTQPEGAAAPAPAGEPAAAAPAAGPAAGPAPVQTPGLTNEESTNASSSTSPAPDAGGQSVRGANVADVQQPGAGAGTAAVAGKPAAAADSSAKPADVAAPAPGPGQRVTEEPKARWTRMTATERESLISTRTAAKKPAQIASRAWEDLHPSWHKTIERALKEHDAAAPVAAKEPAAAPAPAPEKEKFHASIAAAEEELKAKGRDTHEIVRDRRGLVVRPKAVQNEVAAPHVSPPNSTAAAAPQEPGKPSGTPAAPPPAAFAAPAPSTATPATPPAGGEQVPAPAEAPKPEPGSGPKVSKNTIFTDDAAAAARAILRKKLGTLNSGIDPELLQAGLTLAGWHIENGARTFGAYAKAMLEDMGDAVKPYLKSWYMAVKYDPRASEMSGELSSAGFVEEFDTNSLTYTQSADNAAEKTSEAPDANASPTDQVPGERAPGNQPDAAAGDGNREPLDAGLAGQSGEPAGNGAVPADAGSAGSAGARGSKRTGERAPRAPRGDAGVRSGSSTASDGAASLDPATAPASDKPALDFNLEGEDIGKGGLTAKYRDNLAAIRILKAMATEGRKATPDERRAIARYVGWGALKGVFDPANKAWNKQHEELKGLLTEAEWKAARASTLNAHYTSKDVVSGIYGALEHLGFTTGRILEPSVGVGNFFGLMPAAMRKSSVLHGVELDPLTSQIAAALYPSAKIANTGFEEFSVPAEFFDLAIGNPPFGSEPLVDMERSPYSGMSIHNYFFAKSIDKLRPGGLLAMVVSHNFLDAQNTATRKWISERAKLVGAVRLPNTAFKENAGTEVVTDIVLFQKLTEAERVNGLADASWVDVGKQTNENPKTGEKAEHTVSSYFLENPKNVLGRPSAGGTMYRANEYTVEGDGRDLADALTGWTVGLPSGIFEPIDRTKDMEQAVDVPEGVKVGSFFVDAKGAIQQRGDDRMGSKTAVAWVAPNARAEGRMRGMVGLRDALRDQMRLERSTTATDAEIDANRKRMNALYDEFSNKFGYVNDATNRRLFLDDTDAPLVQMLEFDYDKGVSAAVAVKEEIPERAPSARKADIFERRVLFPPQENIVATSGKDALLASLNYRGGIDLPYMERVYGKSQAAILEELGDLVYQDPIAGPVTADAYLSGDVKTKLEEAKAAAKTDSAYRKNVAALEKVIPVDKMPSEIHASLGASFVPADVIDQFSKHVSGANAIAHYVKATGQWLVEFRGNTDRVKNTTQWGTKDMDATTIMVRTMLGQSVVVKQTIRNSDGTTTTILLEKETEAARAKQAAMKEEWQRWLWSDPARADRIATIYNEKMNRWVDRAYDGSHLTFPGMNPAITLLGHQKNGVWRALQSRQVLLDHVVGAGKTFQIVAAFMEMRRMGIARKPFLTVPNHLTLQWRDEFARLYPGAKVLAATPEDFAKGAREKFFAKIVTGDWDAVIVGHSSLKKIALPAETERAVLEEQVQEIADAIEDMKRTRGDRNILRDMEGIKKRLEARMKERLSNLGQRDKVLTFDELGLDALSVDELHEFKNLFYNTTMERNAGMGNPTGSDKAFDLFVKVRWLFDTYGDKAPLITATGTPVSNSLVEMFNMQRLMQYPTLKEEGLHVFDGWANQFGSVESLYEVAPSGTGYRTASRFAKFKNLPALMAHYSAFADTITLDDLKAQEEAQGKRFPVPKLETGRPMLVVAKRSPSVAEFMGVPHLTRDEDGAVRFGLNLGRGESVEIVQAENGAGFDAFRIIERDEGDPDRNLIGRYTTQEQARLAVVQKALTPDISVAPESILGQFQNLRQLTKDTKGKVNALSLTGKANKAGLDYRLIDPSAPDFAGSKINLAVSNMLKKYHEWADRKGTQLVFCDLSIPLSSRNTFGTKERRVYVRDGLELVHKRGTMHTVDGFEELPFFVLATKAGTGKVFSVYDAASGLQMQTGLGSKDLAKAWATNALRDEDSRENWIQSRERAGELSQEQIDDYNNEHEIDTEESEGISRQDIAGMSQATGFSVYDDIKAKLVKAGIPEREVAFIHDYSTPTAKAKLFSAVKRGDVRFLLGSTPKLGAGTNVQDKLVGLHHIDAPWRPSDLEQREGRIIRRGNEFYNADPDGFEASIWRYATEQTYDTRRWQILEHKARVIEQLRKYDGTTNEIEDVDGEAASAADMKAAASGDPLILEETKLRNEVKRLENLQSAHADGVATMHRRARSSTEYAQTSGPKERAEYERRLATVNANPADKEGWAPFKVNGKPQADKEGAIAEIQRAIARTLTGFGSSTFTYRGLDFDFANEHSDTFSLRSPGGNLLDLFKQSDAISASGFLTRFANYAARLPAHIEEVNRHIEDERKNAEGMRQEAQKPFAEAGLLVSTREEFRKVQRQLIAKGPEVPANEKPVLASALKEQREALIEAGYGDALKEFGATTEVPQDISDRPNVVQTGDPIANTTDVLFRQGEGSTSTAPANARHVGELQQVVDAIRENWKKAPDVRVLPSVASAGTPPAVLAEARKVIAAGGSIPSGVIHVDPKEGPVVYLFADRIDSQDKAAEVLFHEVLGHYGLRGTFGDLEPILRQVVQARQADVNRIVRRNGFLPKDREATREEVVAARLRAAEELLAHMAETTPHLGFVQRAIAAIKTFLRKVGVLDGRQMSDDEIVRSFILPARAWVETGGKTGTGFRSETAFSQDERRSKPREVQVDGVWRPDSNADGKPLHPKVQGQIKFWRNFADRYELDDQGRPKVSAEESQRIVDELGGDIMFSQGDSGMNDPRDFFKSAMGALAEYRDTPGKLNWWQKTFGTPYDLAQRQPLFKRVYDKVQDFLGDVSHYATEAADMAPRILPKLDTWRDWKKAPMSAEDTKALTAPVFEGTLLYSRDERGLPVKVSELEARYKDLTLNDKAKMLLQRRVVTEAQLKAWEASKIDVYEGAVNNRFESEFLAPGLVFKDAELKSLYNLTPEQTGLYREALASAHKSLSQLALSDLVRYGGEPLAPIADQIMGAKSLTEASDLARDYLMSLADSGTKEHKAYAATADTIVAKATRAQRLIDKGYFPLSRFGKYTVDVVDKDGERVYFSLFEDRMEARRAAARMRKEFPEATIRRGTTSEHGFEMFRGLTPETAELFGEMLGLEADGDGASNLAFQKFLKEAKAGRSAMKRLIERKGIAGFSEDVGRVLAGFVYSNARQTSHNLHTKEIGERVNAIPQGQGELKDAAVKLQRYVMEPQEEAVGLRNVLFAQFLGGSVAAMLVNMTQPFAVTMPYLTQFANLRKVGGYMVAATRDVWKAETGDKALDAALKSAAERGIVAPQEVHQLMKQGQGKGALVSGDGTFTGNAAAHAKNLLNRAGFLWGQPFAIAELFNRRVTFIAAYRLATEKGMDDPAGFAEKAITDTQFIYNKGNKPVWARGAVGGVLFTFKQYSISYLELVHRMATRGGPEGKKAALTMLAMLMLMGGAGGLPFMDDVSDLIDGIGQRLGYNLRTKRARQKFLEDTFGQTLGGILDRGVTGLPGMPIDVSSRFGMGNIIPGTGLLTKKEDHTRDVTELLGPAGDLASRAFQGANMAMDGRPVDGALNVAPKAFGNLAKAYDMATLGYYPDAKNRKVVDTTAGDVFSKALGFQPVGVSRVQQATADVQQLVGFAKMKETEIADKLAMALFKGDSSATQSARDELAAWNRDNPDSPIRIKPQQITKRVREMRKTKEERVAGSAPREIRATVKKELQEGNR